MQGPGIKKQRGYASALRAAAEGSKGVRFQAREFAFCCNEEGFGVERQKERAARRRGGARLVGAVAARERSGKEKERAARRRSER